MTRLATKQEIDEMRRAGETPDICDTVYGAALKVTKEELEGKTAFEKLKYILEAGHIEWDQITLVKVLTELSHEIDSLHSEINELKQQLKNIQK